VFVFDKEVIAALITLQDRTLEKIEELFSKPWLERTDIMHYLYYCRSGACCKRRRGTASQAIMLDEFEIAEEISNEDDCG